MLKIGILGVVGVLTALFVKEVKPQFAVFISITTGMLIFFYAVSRLTFLTEAVETFSSYINLKASYLTTLLKIVGITYIADFSSNLCKDAGFQAIAGQIEFFGKISVLAISTPVLLALMDVIQNFLG